MGEMREGGRGSPGCCGGLTCLRFHSAPAVLAVAPSLEVEDPSNHFWRDGLVRRHVHGERRQLDLAGKGQPQQGRQKLGKKKEKKKKKKKSVTLTVK